MAETRAENSRLLNRQCNVPGCSNNSRNSPEKTFFYIPKHPARRRLWLLAIGRDPNTFTKRSASFVCEDHFEMENDMENYMRWKMTGCPKILKRNVVPHKPGHNPLQTSDVYLASPTEKRARLDTPCTATSEKREDITTSLDLKLEYVAPEDGTLDVGLLIEAIQNYEFLYNTADKDYKSAKKKDTAWQELAYILNDTVDEVQRAWKNTRDRFVKEKHKDQSGSEPLESAWPYFNAMLFYSKFTQKRKTYSGTLAVKRKGDESSVLDVGLLIEAIQCYEFLYNVSDKDYKSAKKKNMAWQELAQSLNVTVEEVQKAWKNIRDRFVKEKNRSQLVSEAPEKPWPYFDAMLFYSKYSRRRRDRRHSGTQKKKENSSGRRPSPAALAWPSTNVPSPTNTSAASAPNTQSDEDLNPDIDDVITACSSTGIVATEGRKEAEDDLHEVIATATQLCSSLKSTTRPQATISNKTFAEYAFARLEEMDEEVAKDKRKRMLFILED